MDSDQKNQRPEGGDRKGQPQGGSFVWYLLGLGVLLLLLVTLFSRNTHRLDWHDLERLVRASTPNDQTASNSIEVVDRTADPPKRTRYSNLQDLVIGPRRVTGKVEKTLLSEDGSPVFADDGAVAEPRELEFYASRDHNDQEFPKLLSELGIAYDIADEPNPMWQYMPHLALMVIMLMLIIFMIRRMGGAGSPMAFGRSRGKLYAQEDLEVTFDDVAGIDEAVDELREVVDFLREPERYQRLGGRIPKGVLLVGPPGTGKTLLGKAVAGEAGVPFYSLSGSDFVEMFVGVGAARVRDMFQQAEQRAPCIIFIDELDALGKTRGSGNVGSHDEREQTLNALLVEMDGFGTNSGVIVMGATNRPETLDPALLRPGRFDRNVLVDRPDVAGREEIIEVHLQNIKVDSEVDVKRLAAVTSGFVGADLANMVNEAALLAARSGHEVVGMEEFYEAVERASIGLEKKSRVMLEEEKHRLAVHEGGHALVAYSLPNTDPVHKVSIIPRGLSALGYMKQRPEHDRYMVTKSWLESDLQVLVAGTLAEELIFDDVGTGASNDLDRATEVARSMVMDFGMSRLGRVTYRERTTGFLGQEAGYAKLHSEQTAREIDQEVKRIIDESLERTRQILATRRPALEAITEALLEREVIDAEELAELVEKSSPNPMIVPGTDAEQKPTPPKPTASEGETAEG